MRTLLIWFVLCLPLAAISQHYHFIYIQGHNNQVYYIKKQGEVLSSSATGFIILPRLQSGTHQFTIGFPRNQYPEYEFRVEVKASDRGFSLKNLEDKGWILVDMQTGEMIGGRKLDPPQAVIRMETPKSSDPFSVILASAVGDPGIRETSLVSMTASRSMPVASRNGTAPRTAKTSSQPAVGVDGAISKDVSKADVAKADLPVAPVQQKEGTAPSTAKESLPVVPPVVSAKEATLATTAKEALTKVDSGKTEALARVDPPARTETLKTDQQQARTESGLAKAEPMTARAEAPKAEPVLPAKTQDSNSMLPRMTPYTAEAKIRKISEVKGWKTTELIYVDAADGVTDTIMVLIDDSPAVDAGAAGKPVVSETAMVNRTDCKSMADEKDMMNLRKKVLRQQNEEEMLSLTMKDVKLRCYTVEMLQNMSYVFVTERMRYRLYEEAYPFIFDPANYPRLERLLSTEEYIGKFRALIKSN